MVFTLQRYIFRELAKVFILTTVALTLIMSLCSVLRSVQEYGVGPEQVLHLMGYFLPVTLTFVLPVAALFAGSLVYGRLAVDNELDACRASGISLSTLLYPGLVLAMLVAIANLLFSFHVMPAFVKRAERSFKADARQILFRNIEREGYYKIPPEKDYMIYADRCNFDENLLIGVVAVEYEVGGVQNITTAEVAKVLFKSGGRGNRIELMAHNASYMDPRGDYAFTEWLPARIEFGSLMADDIKFKKVDEMKRIRHNPILFEPIDRKARETYARLTLELLAQDILHTVSAKSDVPDESKKPAYYRLHSGEKIVEFTANNCSVHGELSVEFGGDTVVIEYDASSGDILRKCRCPKAYLYIEGDEFAPTLTMELRNATWRSPDGLEVFARRPLIHGLVLPKKARPETYAKGAEKKFQVVDVLEVLNEKTVQKALGGEASRKLSRLLFQLKRETKLTLMDIGAEIHSRLVFGIGCIPVIMIGVGLGIIKKGGHLLGAFGVSALPALILVVCILMGKNLATNLGAETISGISLMWAGVGILFFLAFLLYVKLLRC